MRIQESNQTLLVHEWDIEQVRALHTSYLRFLKIKRRSEAHRDRVNRSLIYFEKWLAKAPSSPLTQELLEDYALWLMEEARPNAGSPRQGAPGTLSVASQRGYLIDLRSFLRWCVDRGYVPPQAKSWVPVPSAPKHGIKRAQNADISRMLHVAREDLRDYTLCCLLIDCGLRAGEVGTLRIENCSLEDRTLVVNGKTGYRTVVISIDAANVLRLWLEVRNELQGYVFPGRKHGHLSSNGIYQIMMRLRNKADVNGRVNPHAWRHAYISNTAVRGGNSALTQIQAGHASITTTEEYFGFGVAELREYQDRVTALPELMPDAPVPVSTHTITLPRPTPAELEQALRECPNWEALGRRYGVTGAAVKKWAKKWQLLGMYSKRE
jgi:integrase